MKVTFHYFILLLILGNFNCEAKTTRSSHAKTEFKHIHPCPSTGKLSGRCPGYVIDHIQPLKRGGVDNATNMQWQTIEDAKAKDRWE